MTAALVSTLLFGLVIAITPWAIVIVLGLLQATRGLVVAWSYVLGWVVAIAAIGGAVVFWLGDAVSGGSMNAGRVTLVLDVVVGLLLLAYGVRCVYVGRAVGEAPAGGAERPPTPRWLGALEDLRPLYAFALGVFWLNYPLVILWGGEVIRAGLNTAANAILLCILVALGASGVAGLAGYATLAPAQAEPVVAGFRVWTARNARAIATWLALVVGAVLAVRGLVGLV
jgi:hypothetical protein